MFKVFIKSTLRHAVSGIGAALVTKGIVSTGQEAALTEILFGAGMYTIAQVTSWVNARNNEEKSLY